MEGRAGIEGSRPKRPPPGFRLKAPTLLRDKENPVVIESPATGTRRSLIRIPETPEDPRGRRILGALTQENLQRAKLPQVRGLINERPVSSCGPTLTTITPGEMPNPTLPPLTPGDPPLISAL